MEILIDKEKCDGCGLCVDLCPADEPVLEVIDHVAVVKHLEHCEECESCVVSCENGAVTYVDEE